MAPPILDTNILVRHLGQDHADHSPRASQYLLRLEDGEFQVVISEVAIFETVFVLERAHKIPKSQIRDHLLPLIELTNVLLRGKQRLRRTFDLYVEYPRLSFPDAYHAAMASDMGLTEILSFDRDFDRLPGITRIEP